MAEDGVRARRGGLSAKEHPKRVALAEGQLAVLRGSPLWSADAALSAEENATRTLLAVFERGSNAERRAANYVAKAELREVWAINPEHTLEAVLGWFEQQAMPTCESPAQLDVLNTITWICVFSRSLVYSVVGGKAVSPQLEERYYAFMHERATLKDLHPRVRSQLVQTALRNPHTEDRAKVQLASEVCGELQAALERGEEPTEGMGEQSSLAGTVLSAQWYAMMWLATKHRHERAVGALRGTLRSAAAHPLRLAKVPLALVFYSVWLFPAELDGDLLSLVHATLEADADGSALVRDEHLMHHMNAVKFIMSKGNSVQGQSAVEAKAQERQLQRACKLLLAYLQMLDQRSDTIWDAVRVKVLEGLAYMHKGADGCDIAASRNLTATNLQVVAQASRTLESIRGTEATTRAIVEAATLCNTPESLERLTHPLRSLSRAVVADELERILSGAKDEKESVVARKLLGELGGFTVRRWK